jgi:hypothetical protein
MQRAKNSARTNSHNFFIVHVSLDKRDTLTVRGFPLPSTNPTLPYYLLFVNKKEPAREVLGLEP